MAPPALQKALVDTVNFEAVIQTTFSTDPLRKNIQDRPSAYKQTNLT